MHQQMEQMDIIDVTRFAMHPEVYSISLRGRREANVGVQACLFEGSSEKLKRL